MKSAERMTAAAQASEDGSEEGFEWGLVSEGTEDFE
jgi:hypothetical protein